MINSSDISFHPAILHMRQILRQVQPSLTVSLLDNEPLDHLMGLLTTQESLESILNQQLFGSLSSPIEVGVREQKNGFSDAGNKTASVFKSDEKALKPTTQNARTKHVTKVSAEKQGTTDSLACIERLWEQWQNQASNSESGRSQPNAPRNRHVANKPLASMSVNNAPIPTTPFSSSLMPDKGVNAALSTPTKRLIDDLQKALTHAPRTIPYTTPIAPTTPMVTRSLIPPSVSSQAKEQPSPTLLPIALTELVDQLWTAKPNKTTSASVTPQPNSKTTATATQSASVKSPSSASPSIAKHPFQAEVQNMVKTMGLKPISATPQTNAEKNIASESENIISGSVATPHSKSTNTATDDQYKLLDKINQMLREQAQRNGVDIS